MGKKKKEKKMKKLIAKGLKMEYYENNLITDDDFEKMLDEIYGPATPVHSTMCDEEETVSGNTETSVQNSEPAKLSPYINKITPRYLSVSDYTGNVTVLNRASTDDDSGFVNPLLYNIFLKAVMLTGNPVCIYEVDEFYLRMQKAGIKDIAIDAAYLCISDKCDDYVLCYAEDANGTDVEDAIRVLKEANIEPWTMILGIPILINNRNYIGSNHSSIIPTLSALYQLYTDEDKDDFEFYLKTTATRDRELLSITEAVCDYDEELDNILDLAIQFSNPEISGQAEELDSEGEADQVDNEDIDRMTSLMGKTFDTEVTEDGLGGASKDDEPFRKSSENLEKGAVSKTKEVWSMDSAVSSRGESNIRGCSETRETIRVETYEERRATDQWRFGESHTVNSSKITFEEEKEIQEVQKQGVSDSEIEIDEVDPDSFDITGISGNTAVIGDNLFDVVKGN